MYEVVGERGAINVTVEDVVLRAGVSRRTFYELFENVDDCLRAAIDHALETVSGHMRAAHDPTAPWHARMRAGVETFVRFLEEEPMMGRLLVVESLGAGSQVLGRRAEVLSPVIREIDAGRVAGRASPAGLSPLTAEGLAGSVLHVLHVRLVEGSSGALHELISPLTSMIVRPYLGPAAARRELALQAPKPPTPRPRAPSGLVHLNRLPMRLTYRTLCVLTAIAEQPGASNRQVADSAGIQDQGQISKLLRRLQRLGLIESPASGEPRDLRNAWALTDLGLEVYTATRGGSAAGS